MTLPAPDDGIGDDERARRLAVVLEQIDTEQANSTTARPQQPAA